MDMEDRLTVGFITKPHGVKGAVKVFPATDDIRRFKPGQSFELETKKGSIPVKSETVQFFKQYAIIKFDIFSTPEEAAAYQGCALTVARTQAVKLKKDEYFIADLIGMKVYADEPEKYRPAEAEVKDDKDAAGGVCIGRVTDVLTTGANEVIVADLDAGEFDGQTIAKDTQVLLPSIKECIRDIDFEKGRVLVHIMPGLL